MKLLLIDNRINDMEVVLDSLLPNIDYIIVDFQNDTLDSIQSNINNKNQTYEYIGIFQENYETSSYQFVESFGSSILTDVSTDDPNLNTWASYIQMIIYFKDVLKMQTLDLMGCNIMNNSNWSYVIQYIQNHVGDIVINSSSDNTGSADMGGNWILESSNENLIGIYFTENIKNYKFVLGVLNNSANPGVLPYIHYKLDRYNEVSQIGLTSGANGVMSQTGVANASYNGNVSCLDLSNNPVYTRDGSCYFDGGSKYVNLPSVTLNSTSGYTFSLWIKFPDVTQTNAYGRFFAYGEGTSNRIYFALNNDTTYPLNIGFKVYNGSNNYSVSATGLIPNIWYHIAVSLSYSATNTSIYNLYINGSLINSSSSNSYPISGVYINNSLGLYLISYMYDVRIYNSVLSNTQIYNLYKNPLDFYPIICYPLNNATDGLVNRGSLYATSSGLPFNCDLSGSTIANLPTFVADSPDRQLTSNTSMLLNSTYSQFVSFPAVSSGGGGFATLNNGLTFSTWFNLTANAGQWSRIFDCGNGTSNNNILLFISSTNSLYFTIITTNGTKRDISITNANLSLNTWYHIAATITYSTTNTSIYNFYLNGVFIYTTTFYYPTTTTRTRNYLGKSNWSYDPYANIKLYDFRIYQNVLSEGQVQKMYNEILTTDWLQLTSASNKYTSCYVKGSLDISGDFIMRNGRLYLPNTSVSAAYLSTNVQCQPFNNVLTGLSTCAGGLRVTKGCSATALYVANSNINYNNISGILQVSSANTTSISVTASYLNSSSNGYTDGLVFTIYSGYMDENTDNFVTYLSRFRLPNTGIVNGIPSISEGTDYIIPENNSFNYYSVMWVGYFKPDVTGVWTFYTTSDDGSYLWIGSSAETGYTRANAVVNNGGLHEAQERSGTISLVAGTYYYIRIIQGEAGNVDNMIVSFSKPGSTTKITNGIGYFYNTESMRYLAFTLLGSPNINATNSTIRSLNTTAMTTTNLYATTGYFKGGVVVKLLEIKMPFRNTDSNQISNIAVGTDILTKILTGYHIYNVVAIGYKVAFTTDNCTNNNYYGSMIGVGNNYNSASVYIGTLVTNILNVIDNTGFGYKFQANSSWAGRSTCFGSNILENISTIYNGQGGANTYITAFGNSCGQNNKSTGGYNSYFGSNSDSSMNTTQNFNNSTTIGAFSQFFDSNQIVFGVSNTRLYVPGSYIGIKKYVPSNPYALDISGNLALSGSLTTSNGTTNITLNINTISTCYLYSTTNNTINSVDLYSTGGSTLGNTGLGYKTFNSITTGYANSVFGFCPNVVSSENSYSFFGYNTSALSQTQGAKTAFGINIRHLNSNVAFFGANIHGNANSVAGLSNCLFGAYSFYNKNGSGGSNSCIGYKTGYNSINPANITYAGYQAGQNDLNGTNNTCIGSDSGQLSSNTLTLQQSSAIGAGAVLDVSNQIVFGTISERLYVPGSYLGIGQFTPGQGTALDISGNAQFPNYLTTGTLITTFSTSAALNTTYNTSNSVRIYSNNTNTCTGIGILMFNKLTTGDTNVLFGNNRSNDIIITTRFNSIFGYNLTNTANPSSGGTGRAIFGAFTGIGSSNQTTFGAYSNSNAVSIVSATFGAFCQYKKTSSSLGSQTLIGYGAGYNSNTSTRNTHAGYQSGQYDIDGSFNCYIGANTGQLSSSTLNLQGSTAIGISAKLDVSNQIVFGTTSERTYVRGSYVGIRKFTPGQGYSVDVSGNMRISQGNLRVSGTGTAQSWPTWSDYRIKENITPLLAEKYTINNLNPVHYTNQLSNKQDIGFIAHEVQCIYPELVYGEKDGSDYQSINYNGFIPILTKEIQDIKEKMHKKEENAKIIRKHEIARSVSTKCCDCMCIDTIDLLPGTWAICYQVCIDVKHALHTKNIHIGLSINNNKQLHNICNYEIIGNFLYSNMEIESFEQNTTIDLIVEYEGNKDSIDFINSKSYLIYKKLSNGAVQ